MQASSTKTAEYELRTENGGKVSPEADPPEIFFQTLAFSQAHPSQSDQPRNPAQTQ
jgi:hypothetical protein